MVYCLNLQHAWCQVLLSSSLIGHVPVTACRRPLWIATHTIHVRTHHFRWSIGIKSPAMHSTFPVPILVFRLINSPNFSVFSTQLSTLSCGCDSNRRSHWIRRPWMDSRGAGFSMKTAFKWKRREHKLHTLRSCTIKKTPNCLRANLLPLFYCKLVMNLL